MRYDSLDSLSSFYSHSGGDAKAVYNKAKNNPVVRVIAMIIIIILVIVVIYEIWKFLYKKQEGGATTCTPPHGCVLLSGVKNGTNPKSITNAHMPPSVHGSDYSMTIWLYVKSSNFGNTARKYKTVFFRGKAEKDSRFGSFQDEQYSVQPGVWLMGSTNKLLLRWETIGRVTSITDCCKLQCGQQTLGKRCIMPDDTIRFCGKTNGHYGMMTESTNAYSMNPNVNPPNALCSAVKTKQGKDWNTNNSNMDNETCIDNIPLDRWFHLAIVTHTQSVDVYVDGKLVNTLALNSAIVPLNDSDLTLCKDSSPSGNIMHGYLGAMTQIRYFKQALTPYDVLRIYSWGPHPFEIPDPDKYKKELEGIGGSIHVSANVSAQHDDAGH